MPFDKEAFMRLKQWAGGAGDDPEEEDAKPYSSLAREGAPEPVIQSMDHDGESEISADDSEESVAPAAAPIPAAQASTPKNPLDADPIMQKYEADQGRLNDLRQAQRGANSIASIGAATQQLALGANRPQPTTDLLRNSQAQAHDILGSEQRSVDNRARVVNAIEARKARETAAQENRKSRETVARENMMTRKDAKESADKFKEDKLNDVLIQRMQNDLDPNKARGGNMAKNQAQVDQADRLKGLYTEANGDIRNLDSRQMEELAIGMNKMLSGSSSGSVTQVQALLPHTVVGSATKLKEWLMNDPTGTDQVKFVQRMAETVEREREIAQGQVKAAQIQRLSAYDKLKGRDPERYQQLLNSYGIEESDMDEKGRYKPPVRGPSESAGSGDKVKVVDPQGNIRSIPRSLLSKALDAGGKLADE